MIACLIIITTSPKHAVIYGMTILERAGVAMNIHYIFVRIVHLLMRMLHLCLPYAIFPLADHVRALCFPKIGADLLRQLRLEQVRPARCLMLA